MPCWDANNLEVRGQSTVSLSTGQDFGAQSQTYHLMMLHRLNAAIAHVAGQTQEHPSHQPQGWTTMPTICPGATHAEGRTSGRGRTKSLLCPIPQTWAAAPSLTGSTKGALLCEGASPDFTSHPHWYACSGITILKTCISALCWRFKEHC